MKWIPALLFLLLIVAPAQAQNPLDSGEPYLRSPRLGINHISLTNEPTSDERYANALALGAGWNRWPLYWNQVEPEPGAFQWENYDALVANDLRHGLQINAILLGRPGFAADGVRIKGLNEPIFADGSDSPRPDKVLNPDNPWVNFVEAIVKRYRPAGELAQREGWAAGEGVRVWEVWNEPDYPSFWEAGIHDYARLLKTAYIVIKRADPDAQVVFGGLLYNTQDNWLARVLAILENDPLREDYNWYFDIAAVHNYTYPWRSGWLVLYVRQTLSAYELHKPIWLNESGSPVWDDYPGPVWAQTPDERLLRSTQQQQAWFFIQSSAYALAEGADVIFFHQLYDDCGNQPAGTNFPTHNGEMCAGSGFCFGDAFGLYRNQSSALCFSSHDHPGTPRPAANAYRLVADIFGDMEWQQSLVYTASQKVTIITFDTADQRIYIIWNRTLQPLTLDLPAAGETAELSMLERATRSLRPNINDIYTLDLPPAVPDSYPELQPGDEAAIGGPPLILIEPVANPLLHPALEQFEDVLVREQQP